MRRGHTYLPRYGTLDSQVSLAIGNETDLGMGCSEMPRNGESEGGTISKGGFILLILWAPTERRRGKSLGTLALNSIGSVLHPPTELQYPNCVCRKISDAVLEVDFRP